MDELLLDFSPEELEEIQSLVSKFDYPVVYVGDTCFTFNSKCSQLIGEAINFFVTPEYVLGIPVKRNTPNAFNVCRAKGHYTTSVSAVPTKLKKEKKLQRGYRKIYKYKNGFAFKRYEIIEKEQGRCL